MTGLHWIMRYNRKHYLFIYFFLNFLENSMLWVGFLGNWALLFLKKKIFLCASSVSEYIVKDWYTLAFIFVSFFFGFLKKAY